ncbi:LOW QUALITY PROTEIN: putative uncharacterized protein YKR104W [Pollicipes pollicipes]|uniref:LOW QUALITY PROTEIN: putative uncharacterized protein YKR104W n=1 Tax=Pollicipes pollicipes TaxID=41117 RepID=UPI001884FA07|nr:LOW QUALITY PROTEIN: putative uncharacterized protein YKR104W [Pollicipes pollicipes]
MSKSLSAATRSILLARGQIQLSTVLYGILWRCLVTGIRNTKHIENVLRSPVLHHLTSTVGGLSVIRSYGSSTCWIKHTSSILAFRLANSWFCLRADELGLVLLATIAAVLLLVPGASPAEAGLMLSLVYDTVGIMPFLVMLCSELSALMSAVERCSEYCQGLEYEAPAEMPNSLLPALWPEFGSISLDGVSLRYRADLPRVLHDLSLTIPAGEKVGIVGRTGAGKSTLISTLLRLMDLETGRVIIDNVDISKIGLRQLRSRIAVIPQDPVLFTGTIRQNLDPFEAHDDARLWLVLERAGLKAKVARLPLQLMTPVTSDGDSFSVGEKQLVCLGRALLRQNRILLLDEATASVDVQTDFLIQRTIHEDFQDATVVTIAHRLNTVLGYGTIVVMDAGRIAEMGPPAQLAAEPRSQFRQMLEQAGISSLEALEQHSLPPLAEQEAFSDVPSVTSPSRVLFSFSGDSAELDELVDKAGTVPPEFESDALIDRAVVTAGQEPEVEITRL